MSTPFDARYGLVLVVFALACNDLVGLSPLELREADSAVSQTDSDRADSTDETSPPPCTAVASGAGCPPKMLLVPGGCYSTYLLGTRVSVDAFCFDQTEVILGDYQKCVTAGECAPAPTQVSLGPGEDPSLLGVFSAVCNANHLERVDDPINCIPWSSANEFCRAAGKRLPTNDEWEWAARGGERAFLYPWGNAPPKGQLCWSGVTPRGRTCAAGAFPAGDDPLGLHDLGGNVDEWTADLERGTTDSYVVRGGNWFRAKQNEVGLLAQGSEVGANSKNTIGFRCASSP